MSQHFLLSAKARTLSLASVLRMTDEEAETVFRNVRWIDSKAICPHCECTIVYECRRPNGTMRFRCKACRKDFSITSGTLFAHPWGEGGRRPAPDLIRPDDKSRYRSIAAVPIKATSNGRPWGVVVASSDEKGFYSNTPSQGAKTITLETPRSLAMMVSLAIEACGAPH